MKYFNFKSTFMKCNTSDGERTAIVSKLESSKLNHFNRNARPKSKKFIDVRGPIDKINGSVSLLRKEIEEPRYVSGRTGHSSSTGFLNNPPPVTCVGSKPNLARQIIGYSETAMSAECREVGKNIPNYIFAEAVFCPRIRSRRHRHQQESLRISRIGCGVGRDSPAKSIRTRSRARSTQSLLAPRRWFADRHLCIIPRPSRTDRKNNG